MAAVLEELTDGDIDRIIEEYENDTGSLEEIPVEVLEDLILAQVEKELPVEDMLEQEPHLEFDLAGMDTRELAAAYREQVSDLFSLGADVVGRQIDYADVETIIGHSPAPPFEVQEDDEFNKSGKEFNLGEWGVFNCSLRATLLLLAYQQSSLETAGALLRLLRHMFRNNADKLTTFHDLDKFVEFARLSIYEENEDLLSGDGEDDDDDDAEEENSDSATEDDDKESKELDELMNALDLESENEDVDEVDPKGIVIHEEATNATEITLDDA